MASFRALTLQSGKFKQQQDADTLIIGAGLATSTGAMSMDTGSSAAITIGGATASSVAIGRTGQMTTVKGDLTVDGAEVVTGSSTMNGNVIFGDDETDTALFKARLTSTGQIEGTTLPFLEEEDHVIGVDTSATATAVGGALTVRGGTGATTGAGGALNLAGGSSGATDAAIGGVVNIDGGTSTATNGVGGAVSVDGGLGTGTGAGGALTLDGGSGPGAGADGAITIGGTAGGTLTIGRAATYTAAYYVTPIPGGANVLLSSTASSDTSGASAIGVDGTALTTSGDSDLQDVLESLDAAIAATASTLQQAYDAPGGNTIVTDATGNIAFSGSEGFTADMDKQSSINVTSADLLLSTTTSGEIDLTSAGAIDANAATVTIDTSSTTVMNSVGASGWTNDTGALSLATTTSGTLGLNGVAEVDITAGTVVDVNAATMTIDTSSTTVMNSVGASGWTNDTGALSLATTTSGTLGLNGVAEVDVTSGGLMDINAGANLDIDVTGTYDMLASSTFSVSGTGNSQVNATSGDLTLKTTTTGDVLVSSSDGEVDLTAVTVVDINGATCTIDTTSTTLMNSVGASGWTNDTGALTLATTTSGTLGLNGVAEVDITAGANLDINVTGTYDMLASSTVTVAGTGNSSVTITSGDLTLATATAGDVLIGSADGEVDLTAVTVVDINGATCTIDTSSTTLMNSAGGSGWTNDTGALTLATTTSGTLGLNGVAEVDITAGANLDINVTGTYDMAATSTANFAATVITLASSAGDVNITTVAGDVDIDPAANGDFDVTCTGTGFFSLDAGAASNLTVTGANDLTFGAHDKTITLNQVAPNDDLDAGFTATSIVGALNELFDGVGGSITTLVTSQVAGETIAVGNLVAIDNAAGSPKVYLADANGAGELENPIGFAQDAAILDGDLDVIVSGSVAIADAEWVDADDVAGGVPAVTNVGQLVFMARTPGSLTLDISNYASGDIVHKVGLVSKGGAGAAEVIVQIGDGTEL